MVRIGVDVGGTFTDFAMVGDRIAGPAIHKQLTTPDDPSRAVLEGVAILLARQEIAMGAVSEIVHGTTLVTNAVIERKGARTGMLVTAGFADTPDMGLEQRYDLFDLRIRFAPPVVPRACRREVAERIRWDGSVETAPDEAAVVAAIRHLVDEHAIEALAVCFLHSYANPAHELQVGAIAATHFPGLYVSMSADIFPYMREFERWTTAAVNAYTQPRFDAYLCRLESGLEALGFGGKVYLMSSSGGAVAVDTARRYPVRMLESGPAAGVLMSALHVRRLGIQNVLAFDLGGTTAKGALIRGGRPLKNDSMEVARIYHHRRGSGLSLKLPVIDMTEIGAGGGSTAGIDERGLLRVGPRSAGAAPGPACYAQGGQDPTLTDANLVLGYLDPAFFLGGGMDLDRSLAEAAIGARIGTPLGLDLLRAAWGIHETINEDIARAFRIHAVERGADCRDATIVAFGGGGPIHATGIARKLKAARVVFPIGAGVMSALGLLASPMLFETVRSECVPLGQLNTARFTATLDVLSAEASGFLTRAGVAPDDITIERRVDIRYHGQGYDLEVPVADGPADAALAALPRLFADRYREVFKVDQLDETLELTTWKVEARGPVPAAWAVASTDAPTTPVRKGSRSAYLPHLGQLAETPVWDRYVLRPGDRVAGPALIEERESTCLTATRRYRDGRRPFEPDRGDRRMTSGTAEFDAVTLGILWDRLISISDEIVETLVRTSFSTIVREGYDLSVILFDRTGAMMVQGTRSIPVFIGTAPATLAYMLEHFPPSTLQPGDVVVTNDPVHGTGHLFDISVMRPLFRGGALAGYTMSITHLPDIGGMGFSAAATEMFHEGLRLPVCKLYATGRIDPFIVALIRANVRVPEQVMGDILANVSCNEVGAAQLLAFMDEYGIDDLVPLSAAIRKQSERGMRDRIRLVPDGTYRNQVAFEGLDGPLQLAVTIVKQGDNLDIDFAGSSGTVRGGINVPFCYTRAMALYSIKCLTAPTIPHNAGSTAPIRITAPPGCILNAQPPAATAGRHVVGHFVTALIFGALQGVMPDQVQADCGMINILTFQGRQPDGRELSTLYFVAGGFGALQGLDGQATTPGPSNMGCVPTEVWEARTGVTILSKRLRPDSGGAGQWRGGLGQEVMLRNDTGHLLTVFSMANRTEFPAKGLLGGEAGALREHRINGAVVDPRGRQVLQPGEVFTLLEAGGGGMGPPSRRDLNALAADVAGRAVSAAEAIRVYGQ